MCMWHVYVRLAVEWFHTEGPTALCDRVRFFLVVIYMLAVSFDEGGEVA